MLANEKNSVRRNGSISVYKLKLQEIYVCAHLNSVNVRVTWTEYNRVKSRKMEYKVKWLMYMGPRAQT